jgi:hypothetical protein
MISGGANERSWVDYGIQNETSKIYALDTNSVINLRQRYGYPENYSTIRKDGRRRIITI